MPTTKHTSNTQIASNGEESMALRGYVDAINQAFNFSNSMVLKCAVDLRIADIIHSSGQPLTLSQISSSINSPSVNLDYLHRVMRMLVRMKIFSVHKSNTEDKLIRYGMTPSSKSLLYDDEFSSAPLLLMLNHPLMSSPWHRLSDCVREGGTGFKKTHGCELFEMASLDPEFNKVFSDAMRCTSKLIARAIFETARDVFSGIGTMVDVGGGVGHMISQIVMEFKHIKGINFDMAHVVELAPKYDGITHVAGDMFSSIPSADAIFMQHILHDWGDEDCIKILKNCRNAINNEKGKVIIVDMFIKEDEEDEGLFGNLDVMFDIMMMVDLPGGKERTELEWKKILEESGFARYNVIKLPTLASLIEAFPK